MNETPTEHDVTKPFWGHNVSMHVWDKENNRASGSCWLTPGPKDGDILIIAGQKGPIRLKVYNVRWVTSVDDMYHFDAVPAGAEIPKPEPEVKSPFEMIGEVVQNIGRFISGLGR